MSSHPTHSSSTASLARNRQYTHLQSQLAQLNAHLADTENLLAMTAVQAEYLRGFMSASKVLGEEGNNSAATAGAAGGGDRTKAGRE
ncbi:MAG: hypothetical protein Q9185_003067 [Variospora sp. 1 TL-2023]